MYTYIKEKKKYRCICLKESLFLNVVWPKNGPNYSLVMQKPQEQEVYFFSVFLGRSTAWMLGSTPPWAMVTPERSLFNSSSLRMASWRCLGMILVFLLSRAALPASSNTSAARYSMTAARYTGAPAPTRSA